MLTLRKNKYNVKFKNTFNLIYIIIISNIKIVIICLKTANKIPLSLINVYYKYN